MKNTICVLVAAASCCGIASANQVVNGGFQTGLLGPSTSTYAFDNTMYPPATWNIVSYDTLHGSWQDFYDHTYGDERGWYMIVNGTDQGLGPAWAQTVTVTANTDYNLSGWFATLIQLAPASLEFRVNGVTISPIFSAPNNAATWEQRSVSFNSGNNTSLSIEIWDTNQVFSGNDYAIDDISLEAVPAPGSLALAGVAGLSIMRRRRP
ncbi:MAG: PEP-CTERM sorting domain-containing protein [Phycisphaeraceae bacterium]|nr:PEP-CTERM sorting domain-containing protein [Phycisphaeraceae bacterium]